MRIPTCMTFVLLILACHANATTTQPENNGLIDNDMKTCYGKLNELKRVNHGKYNVLNKKLMAVVQSQASLNVSKQYASQETVDYITSLQTKTIKNICVQISQNLDAEMLKKAIVSLNN